MSFEPLNWLQSIPGKDFIIYYVLVGLLSFALVYILRKMIQEAKMDPNYGDRLVGSVDAPYVLGFLNFRTLNQVALASLMQKQILKYDYEAAALVVAKDLDFGSRLNRYEKDIHQLNTEKKELTINQALSSKMTSETYMKGKLQEEGLLLRGRRLLLWQSTLIAPGMVGLAGCVKTYLGLTRGKPVFFLFVAIAALLFGIWQFLKQSPISNPARTMMERFAKQSSALQTTAKSDSERLSPYDVAMATAIVGLPLIDGGNFSVMAQAIKKGGTYSSQSWGSSSGWSGWMGCGSGGGSGCGGGGGCGGGCGGCGG